MPDPSLWLEVTPRCNLNCVFCYNPWRPRSKAQHPEVADYAEYSDGVRRLLRMSKFGYVAVSGGEPLLHSHVDDLVTLLAEASQHAILTTNGRLFSRARAARLKNAGLAGLQVPLLAVTPSIHDELSQRESWNTAMRAIVHGLELGLETGVTFVTTSRNFSELPDLAHMLGAMGVQHLVVSRVNLQGSALGRHDLQVDPADMSAVTQRAVDAASAWGMDVRMVPRDDTPAGEWHRLAISPDAELKLCNQSSATLGRLSEMSDVALMRLVRDVASGQVAAYRGRVTNCDCFDRRFGPAGAPDAASR